MPCATSIEEAVQMAEQRWIGLQFRRKSAQEAESCCPDCGGKDRFIVFSDPPRFWCRQCNMSGFLENRDPNHRLTEAEITEIRLKRLERKQEETDRRLSALERLNRSNIHERYHANLDEQAYNWWCAKGVECWAIQDYKLGYCPRCPTDKEHRSSYTIPLWDQNKSALLNLRHRLTNAPNGDKYRPELAGLGTCLAFPHHLVGADMGIIVEGSVKALVAHQYGIPTVGIMGKRGRFQKVWLDYFPTGKPIYIGLDPDATESANRLAHGIAKTGKEVYVARFPDKPDDMLVGGCTVEEWMHYIKQARRVH